MDPNVMLAEMRQAITAYDLGEDQSGTIIECAQALDEWLSRGGFKPEAWK